MASPYVFEYVVTEQDGPITYAGTCYGVGETIKVKHADKACFYEMILPAGDDAKCFPEYCLGADGYPTGGYRVAVLVPAGGGAISEVPAIEGCRPPNMVCFHYCAPCLYVEYDADPVFDPADPNAANGGAADPNPTCRDLIENGVCVQTIHMANPSDADITVTLSYYC